MPFPDETESKMIQLVSRAEAAEARVAELEADLLKSHREGDELVLRWKDAVSVIRLLAPCLSGIGDQEREALAAAQPYLSE